MSVFSAYRREANLCNYSNRPISDRAYNGILCGVVLYGIIVTAIICNNFGEFVACLDVVFLCICCLAIGLLGGSLAENSTNPVISFIGFNMVVIADGFLLSGVVYVYGGLKSKIVLEALFITFCIVVCMTLIGILKPEFCSNIGGILAAMLIGMLIAQTIFLRLNIYDNCIFAWIGAIVYSGYIAYDVYCSQQYPKTMDNAVDRALDIYMDIVALFFDILRILSSSEENNKKN